MKRCRQVQALLLAFVMVLNLCCGSSFSALAGELSTALPEESAQQETEQNLEEAQTVEVEEKSVPQEEGASWTDSESEPVPEPQSPVESEESAEPEEQRKGAPEATENAEEEKLSEQSLLPLREEKAYLILTNRSDEEIRAMPVTELLEQMVDQTGARIHFPNDTDHFWINFKRDEDNVDKYERYDVDSNETVDLSMAKNNIGYVFELIAGGETQLDKDNTRYIVWVYTGYPEKFRFELYSQELDGSRRAVEVQKTEFVKSDSTLTSSNGRTVSSFNYALIMEEQTILNPYLGITSQLEERPDMSVELYEVEDFVDHGFAAAELSGCAFHQDMKSTGSGYRMKGEGAGLVAVYYLNGVQVDVVCLNVLISGRASEIQVSMVKKSDGGSENVVKRQEPNFRVLEDDSDTQTCILRSGYSALDPYHLSFRAVNGYGLDVSDRVEKAVVGHYKSLEETQGLPDIKDKLFSSEGYQAVYGGDGVRFSLFFQEDDAFGMGKVYHFTVNAINEDDVLQGEDTIPIVGTQDPWFRIQGVRQDGEELDSYVVENGKSINMDTMYGYGYQTLLLNSKTADLSSLEPEIWLADEERMEVWVNGRRIQKGDTVDFSRGPVQFTLKFEDHVKNYLVQVVKQQSGPALFVNGPTTQEVFLDEYFEYKHDILIANLGDEPLTGLRVSLNATNCKLDEYWTVGGSGNDTLGSFKNTQRTTEYGELPNLAKIRLLPDGEGQIKGTLTIRADNQPPVVLNLTGRAQNPKITTQALSKGVKYVPYSHLITTNNMYDWNEVSFSVEGRLPEGIELYERTGELYGVPREAGSFPLTVTASFNSETYSFESSTVHLNLVIEENTDTNVYEATDEDYVLEYPIGVDEGNHSYVLEEYEDELFWSQGELTEFVDLWLNGERLEPGVDYDAEHGSTKITIRKQTFEQKAKTGETNTIAAEFRTKDTKGKNDKNDRNKLKRTAQNFRIKTKSTKKRIGACSIKLNKSSLTYNGKVRTPGVSVSDEGRLLRKGKDYTLSYKNNKNAGTGKVKISGIGSYSGNATAYFTIRKAKNTVTLNKKKWTCTASSLKEQHMQIKGKTVWGKLSYRSSNRKVRVNNSGKVTVLRNWAGTATITVTSKGNKNYTSGSAKLKVVVSKQ